MSEYVSYGYTTRALVWSNSTVLGKGIFMGCDNHLYLYKVEEDAHYLIYTVGAGYNIKRLWIDGDILYGAAWENISSTIMTTNAEILKYDGTDPDIITTLSAVFTGEACIRDGGVNLSTNHRNIGFVSGSHISGENAIIPFNQYLQCRYNGLNMTPLFAYNPNALETGSGGTTYMSHSPVFPHFYNKGYYAFSSTDDSIDGTKELNMKFWLGQYGCMELDSNYGNEGGIFYATSEVVAAPEDETQISYKIYNIGTNSVTTLFSNFQINSIPFQPTCCQVSPSGNVYYVGGMCWHDSTSHSESKSYVMQMLTNDSFNTLYDSTNDSSNIYRTFLNMKFAELSGSNFLHVTFLNRDKLNTGEFGGIGTHPVTSQDSLDGVRSFSSIPTGLVKNDEDMNAFIATSDGSLYKYIPDFAPPTVTTQAVTDITTSKPFTATGNGNITNVGVLNCDIRGICWNVSGNPTINDFKVQSTGDFGTGAFTKTLTNLINGQRYYVKAYAHNSMGYSYGSQVSFEAGLVE